MHRIGGPYRPVGVSSVMLDDVPRSCRRLGRGVDRLCETAPDVRHRPVTPMLEQFLADLQAIQSNDPDLPRTEMRLRWFRKRNGGVLASDDPGDSRLTVLLYPADADARTRPAFQCLLDPLSDLSAVEQRSTCEVVGQLAPGRGVAVVTGSARHLASYPLRRPLRGPRLGA